MADGSEQTGFFDQISGLGNELFSDAIFGDEFEKLVDEKPDLAKEILANMDSEKRQLIDATGQINRDALRKELTLKEKFSLMAKLWIAENLSDAVMSGVVGEGKKVESSTFADTYAGVKKENQLNEGNIFWPTAGGNMGKAGLLWNLKGQVEQADGETLRFMTGSTLVMPSDGGEEAFLGLDVSAALQIGLLKHGITLKTVKAEEAISSVPGDKEIQVVLIPPVGLPMKEDGITVDVKAIQDLGELFKRGQVQWFSNPLLMASIFAVVHPVTDVSGTGDHIKRMMSKFGLSSEEDKKQLTELFPAIPPSTQTEPIATPTPAAAPVALVTTPASTAEVPPVTTDPAAPVIAPTDQPIT